MKNKLLSLLFVLAAMNAWGQTDVSKYYLSNYGFDTSFNYVSGGNTAVAQEILDINGWTRDFTADYTISGVYEFGFGGTFNNGTVPATGYDGEAGGGLALSTGLLSEAFCFR